MRRTERRALPRVPAAAGLAVMVLAAAWSAASAHGADAVAGAKVLSPDDVKLKDDLELPDGFGPVKLGMTLEEARKAMPSLPVDENVMADARLPVTFKYAVARLRDQPFGELKGCEVTLHFYRERFIYYGVHCPDVGAARNYLLTAFGAPGLVQPDLWQWTTEPRSMTFVPASGAIAVAENEGVRAYQLELLNLPRAPQGGAAAQEGGGGPPAPAPATP